MPKPDSASTIAKTIGEKRYKLREDEDNTENEIETRFDPDSKFVKMLAKALYDGWTSESPDKATTMEAKFKAEFGFDTDEPYLKKHGKAFVECIATGIDDETGSWVKEYDEDTGSHDYQITKDTIIQAIKGCTMKVVTDAEGNPVWPVGAKALTEAVATAFMNDFDQSKG